MIKFRAWVKPDILINHLNGVIAEALAVNNDWWEDE